MSDHYRQTLIHLRFEVNLMRDNAFTAVAKSAADRMLATIDSALAAPAPPATISIAPPPVQLPPDPSKLSGPVLLRELGRRMDIRIPERPKFCVQCMQFKPRARGLCKHCYRVAYRRRNGK